MQKTPLEKKRLSYTPKLPNILKDPLSVCIEREKTAGFNNEKLKILFKNTYNQEIVLIKKSSKKKSKSIKIGVFFSGGQAPGGHNVIFGLFDSVKKINKDSLLIGFLNGPDGVIENNHIKIDENILKNYKNQGGFDFLGSSRTKIESKEQKEKAYKTCEDLDLDGLVIIGGDDSNTNGAVLAEYFIEKKCKTKIAGVPKTIDGDLQNDHIPISFGFDTATKVYSELIGNIEKDALSAKKYYHFIKLMGRSASHIALECALKTNPNYVIVAEEIEKNKNTLKDIALDISKVIIKRTQNNKEYGVVLIPEGLIEFIPEIKILITKLNALLADFQEFENLNNMEKIDFIESSLEKEIKTTFLSLPKKIQEQLLLDRDPHGNVQVSKIETEKLIIHMVKNELKDQNIKFNAISHFFGYEGRAAIPSNFDADYCYSLGYVATVLIKENLTGYIASINNLKDIENSEVRGIPLTTLMNIEQRKGKDKPVIKKALVNLDEKPFKTLLKNRKTNEIDDNYKNPGPIQYCGDKEIIDSYPIILDL